MNHLNRGILLAIATLLITVSVHRLWAAPQAAEGSRKFEYATIRWGGRDNTHVVRPSGEVEFVASQLGKLNKPSRTDDRSFYMNVVMNALAREGYEFAGMSNDDIVMKRATGR